MDNAFDALKSGAFSYPEFCDYITLNMAEYIKGKSRSDFLDIATEFVEYDFEFLYEFGERAITLLHTIGIESFVISGAPQEPLMAYGEKMKFKVIGSLEFAVDHSGKYNGTILKNSGPKERKKQIIEKILKNYGIKIAFGDSESDLCFLNAAEIGILLKTEKLLPKPLLKSNPRLLIKTPSELNASLHQFIKQIRIKEEKKQKSTNSSSSSYF